MKEGKLEEAAGEKQHTAGKGSRGIAILDFILRLAAIGGTIGSAVGMGTADQTLPFSTQIARFEAQYDDFSTFTLFVIANAIACGYLALSLPISIFHIIRRRSAGKSRVLLILLDTIILALVTGGASAAAAIVYLAHNGNSSANWFAICQQFQDFCQGTSGSLIGSFGVVFVLALLVILSGIALSRR